MVAKILEFCRLLRRGGVNISFTQIADALRAVSEAGFCQEDFHIALCSILIADRADKPLFDRLFRLFFLSLQRQGVLSDAAQRNTNLALPTAKGLSACTPNSHSRRTDRASAMAPEPPRPSC